MHKNKIHKILYVINDPYAFGSDGLISPLFMELPLELLKAGYEVQIFQPLYSSCIPKSSNSSNGNSEFYISLAEERFTGNFIKIRHTSGIDIVCVKNQALFHSPEQCMDKKYDELEHINKLAFFSHAVFAYIRQNEFKPDIIHCMGWQTGLIPAIYRKVFSEDPSMNSIKTVFSVTNFFSHGSFDAGYFPHTGLPWSCFNLHEMEFWGKFSLIKAGIVYSHALVILGETHEDIFILNNKSFGLNGVIAKRKDSFWGIPSGIDYSKSSHISESYHKNPDKFMELKNQSRQKLFKKYGLSSELKFPLVIIAGDLSYYNRQGNNLERTLEILCQLDATYLILGKSNHEIIERIKGMTGKCDGNYAFIDNTNFENLADILTGADIILMPTSFKPYPFMPLSALQYGCIPVVSRIFGGTSCLEAFKRKTGEGCGLFFEDATLVSMLGKFISALNLLNIDNMQSALIKNCLSVKFNWEQTVSKYSKIYKNIL